jgi:hypothetical protein
MSEVRIEKNAIRSLWLEAVKEVAKEYPGTDVPWYLTLSGAEARDIQLLIDEGLLSLTEVGSIKENDQHKVVAVERNNQAILELQKKLPGLKIKRAEFRDLIRGDGIFSWPQGDDEKYCRAHIVNLDLNNPLRGATCNGEVTFPVLSWIRKLCQLHARSPRYDWTLCLTLHGEVVWLEEVNTWTKSFLAENLRREPDFAKGCREFLGEELVTQVTGCSPIDFSTLDRTGQQKIIMVMVPKMIAKLVHNEGWNVSTERNLSYGQAGCAPMVTWIVRFTWSSDGSATPDALYRAALKDILSGAGVVTDRGQIETESYC